MPLFVHPFTLIVAFSVFALRKVRHFSILLFALLKVAREEALFWVVHFTEAVRLVLHNLAVKTEKTKKRY